MQTSTALLRDLKGAPLSVLVAMLIARVEGLLPVGEKWLITASGYSQNKVREGLAYLAGRGLIIRGGRYEGWNLSSGAYQLPLTLSLEILPGAAELEAETGESQSDSRDATTTATTLRVKGGGTEEAAAEKNTRESQFDSPAESDEEEGEGLSPEQERENLRALREVGIMGTMAARLAKLARLTPEYIQAHARQAEREGKPIQILICRLRDGDLLPEERSRRVWSVAEAQEEEGEEGEAEPVDSQAEGWWGEMVEELRERLSKSVFKTWIDLGMPARCVGDGLYVLAGNAMVIEQIGRQVEAGVLDGLARTVSGGAVRRVCFVTAYPGVD